MNGYVNALWIGGPAELPDKTQLVNGETEVAIPLGEAVQSVYWNPQLEKLSVDSLRELAKAAGINVKSGLKAPGLIAAIEAAYDPNAPTEPAETGDQETDS